MEISIDGSSFDCSPDETILAVARRNEVEIPSLCSVHGFEPLGACRLCCVEILEDRDGTVSDSPRLVCACMVKAATAQRVRTTSERIDRSRRITLALLTRRTEMTPALQGLIDRYGIANLPDVRPENGVSADGASHDMRIPGCVLCGLCVRACEKVKRNALIAYGNGAQRHIVKPTIGGYTTCNDCGLCRKVCPTGAAAYITETEITSEMVSI